MRERLQGSQDLRHNVLHLEGLQSRERAREALQGDDGLATSDDDERANVRLPALRGQHVEGDGLAGSLQRGGDGVMVPCERLADLHGGPGMWAQGHTQCLSKAEWRGKHDMQI